MELLENIWPYIAALLPTAGLAYLFYVIMKHILEGDRRERIAQRRWEEEHVAEASGSRGNDEGHQPSISRHGHS